MAYCVERINREEWRPVVGYEGAYEVSSEGRVRSWVVSSRCPGVPHPLKLTTTSHGYHRVSLLRDGRKRDKYVHSLAAEAFLGPYPPGMEVNHKDGDKTNNALSNLEYATYSENIAHAYRIGLQKRGAGRPNAKLDESKVEAIWNLRGRAATAAVAAAYGISPSTVCDIQRGRRWGYVTAPLAAPPEHDGGARPHG